MSTLIESLAQDRQAARYQHGSQRQRQRAAARGTAALAATTHTATTHTATAHAHTATAHTAAHATTAHATIGHEPAVRRIAGSTRTRAGWLLIGLGLRLALRGGDVPARGARLLGQ